MRKIFTVTILLVLSLLLVSCKRENDDPVVVTHEQVFDVISIGYSGTDSSLSVTGNIILPTTVEFEGVTIKWISANENVVSLAGVVNRPEKQNIEVLLILEVTIDGVKDTRNFNLIVIATNPDNGENGNDYTVTFNTGEGGSIVTSEKVKENNLVKKPVDPTRAGYMFVGWFTEETGGIEWNFANNIVTANITLYARWQEDLPTFTVTFDSNGGSAVSAITVTLGDLINKPLDPTNGDLGFVGWFKDSELTDAWNFATDIVEADVTLYAKWSVAYTVTFDSAGGSEVTSLRVPEGQVVAKPADPERTGYDFISWLLDGQVWDFTTDTVDSDITLVANWQKQIVYYVVEFDSVGGSSLEDLSVAEETSFDEPVAPTRDNYDFAGWYLDSLYQEKYDFDTIVNEDILLYAKWVPVGIDPDSDLLVISFETNSNIVLANEFTVLGGKILKPNDLVRVGYRFDGWFSDSELEIEFDFDAEINEDTVIYVKWWELPPALPAPIHGIGTQPRPIAHLGIGPYEFDQGLNGGFIGYGFVFNNQRTGEKFVWLVNANHGQGSDFYYTEANLAAAGIVLSGGDYIMNYYARGNGETTSDSPYSTHSISFNIPNPVMGNLSLAIIDSSVTWNQLVVGATYEVYINGELENDNATSPFDLSHLEDAGTYVIKVIAKADGYQNSEATINFVVANQDALPLDTPTNLSFDGTILTWDVVEGSVGYDVTIAGTTLRVSNATISLTLFETAGTQTVYVVAIGDVVNNTNSLSANIEVLLPNLLPRLNPMGLGDQNGNITGYNNGYYRLVAHLGHPVFQQEDWAGTFRFKVYEDGNLLGETVTANDTFLHTPGSSTDFYGALLENGKTYQVHIQLVAKEGSGHRDSEALIVTFTFIK